MAKSALAKFNEVWKVELVKKSERESGVEGKKEKFTVKRGSAEVSSKGPTL